MTSSRSGCRELAQESLECCGGQHGDFPRLKRRGPIEAVDTQASTTEQNSTEDKNKPPNPLRGNCGGEKSKRKKRRRKRDQDPDKRSAIDAWAIAVRLSGYQIQYAQYDPKTWAKKLEQCPADVRKFAEDFGLKSIREGKVEIVRGQFTKMWNDSS